MEKIFSYGFTWFRQNYFGKNFSKGIKAVWLNADEIRKNNDWDFSDEGRNRQAKRMFKLSQEFNLQGKDVIADFICPTSKTRNEFKPIK